MKVFKVSPVRPEKKTFNITKSFIWLNGFNHRHIFLIQLNLTDEENYIYKMLNQVHFYFSAKNKNGY